MKYYSLILSVVAFQASAQSDTLPAHCNLDPSVETTEYISIPGQPNFFFRAFPQSRLISYASDGGNYILDMNTKQRFQLPGTFDPVPMGEKVITVPDYEAGLKLYSVEEIMGGNANPKPIHTAKNLKGVYQSVGRVEKNKDYEIYAAIVAGSEGTLYQKIRVEGLMAEDEGPVHRLCPDVDIKLPMLSKDAKEISGVDGESGVSKIWKINLENSTCEEVENLQTSAGKADFSHDGRELIFHMRGDGLSSSSYFSRVSDDMNMNVYVYNRDTQSIYPVTQSRPGDNSYFPVYREDGSIVYAAVDRAGIAQFAKVHPKDVKSKALNFASLAKSDKIKAQMTLGHIWQLSCSSQTGVAKSSVESILGAAFAINSKQCAAMVQKSYDEEMKLRIKAINPLKSANKLIDYDPQLFPEFSVQELLHACKEM